MQVLGGLASISVEATDGVGDLEFEPIWLVTRSTTMHASI